MNIVSILYDVFIQIKLTLQNANIIDMIPQYTLSRQLIKITLSINRNNIMSVEQTVNFSITIISIQKLSTSYFINYWLQIILNAAEKQLFASNNINQNLFGLFEENSYFVELNIPNLSVSLLLFKLLFNELFEFFTNL